MNQAIEMSPRPAHHGHNGFRNPWPHSSPKGFGAVIKWMLTRSRQSSPSRHDVVPVAAHNAAAQRDTSDLAVTWIGHSTFLVQCDGLSILTDPIWSTRASPVKFAGPKRLVPPGMNFADLPAVDITVLSHDHYDHFDDSTIRRLVHRFPEMTWCVPLGVAPLVRKRGAVKVIEMDWWDEQEVAGVRIGCTPAQHFSGRYPWNRNANLWCGWTIAFSSRKVFFAGDTALHPEFADIARRFGPFDLSILPIGAYEPRWFMRSVHMTPEDTVAAFRELAAADSSGQSVMVGSHWGTFRLTDEPVMQPPELTRSTWSASGLSPDRLWILAHGETRTLSPDH
jgi:N-acyl-phosphatidylethanolamine-hydrolysing phospholipase D